MSVLPIQKAVTAAENRVKISSCYPSGDGVARPVLVAPNRRHFLGMIENRGENV